MWGAGVSGEYERGFAEGADSHRPTIDGLQAENARLRNIIVHAAEFIEYCLPRPGPYHPKFAAVIEEADRITGGNAVRLARGLLHD